MKLHSILALAALSLPLMVSARPAAPGVLRLQNPDGTVVEARQFGDEFFSYTTALDGQTLLEPDARGFWMPAMREGRQLRAIESDLSILRAEVESSPLMASRIQQRMAPLTVEGRTKYPTVGEEDIHALVVLVQYDDIKFTIPDIKTAIDKLCNEPGYSDYDAKGSARDYFQACSDGKFNPVFDVYGPVTLSQDSQFYVGNTPTSKTDRMGNFIYEALTQLAETGEVDFSLYDYDENGIVDNIFFFYAGYGQADSPYKNTIWPHQGDYTQYMRINGVPALEFNGKTIATYACSNELDGQSAGKDDPKLDGIGAFCHEYGHVLGLPDLYDSAYTGAKTPGKFDVMAEGTYNDNSTCPPLYSAYEKWVCNWLEYENAEAGTTYEIAPLTSDDHNAVRIRFRRPGGTVSYYNEYFILESRKKEGWDAALPDEGMFIWHIDYNASAWSNNQVNTGGRSRVQMLGPDEATGQWGWPGWDGSFNVNYPSMSSGLNTASSVTSEKVFLTDITRDNETGVVSVGYNYLTDYPSGITVLHDNPTRHETSRVVYLKWDEVEDADSYLVTVYRTDANGKQWTVDGLDHYDIGNTTSVTVRNITASAWEQEFTAYVTTVKYGVPAQKSSNVIKFIPSQLEVETGGGVGEITAADGIYGSHGCVVAPEDAEVYTISGMRVANENLPAGLYIVRYQGRSAKVTVK